MLKQNKIEKILDNIKKIKVLIIGDIMLDNYISGNVERISPEAPIPILKNKNNTFSIGGAGNVLKNLVSLNIKASFISVIGKDEAGKKLLKLVSKLNNVEYALINDINRKTTVKTRYLAEGQQIFRSDDETTVSLNLEIKNKLFNYFKLFIKQADIVIFSDYGKGIFSDNYCQKLIKYSKTKNKKVIIDPKGDNFNKYKGSFCVTPNISEAANACNIFPYNNKKTLDCGKLILNKKWSKNVLLTRGADGLSIIEKNKFTHINTNTAEVFDVTGAGDTVIALFSAAIAAKFSILDSANFANIAASIVVKKIGTNVVKDSEIKKVLSPNGLNLKIIENKKITEKIKLWKLKKFKIGFTNGCFDLLHSGHIDLLSKASEKCDKLIVALNSDISIKHIKGNKRPILDLDSRKNLIAALESVDLVVTFNEKTPLKLIKKFKPDILIKGADYKVNEIVGSDFVQSYGGKIIRITLTKNQSTTKLIERIINNHK